MIIKKIVILILLAGFFFLSSCSPKSSQPCPHVYKTQTISQNLC